MKKSKLKLSTLRRSVQPGYRIIRHPRRFDKPLSCRSGLHGNGLVTKFMNGVPILWCKKCGEHIGKAIYERTATKRELMESDQRRTKPRTKKEIMLEAWAKLERLRKHYTDSEIKRLMRRRLAGEI